MENYLSVEQVKEKLAAYFHDDGRNNSYRITTLGNLIDLEIEYYNFKPIKVVRHDLDEMIPNLNSLSIFRGLPVELVGEDLLENNMEEYNEKYTTLMNEYFSVTLD